MFLYFINGDKRDRSMITALIGELINASGKDTSRENGKVNYKKRVVILVYISFFSEA